ncbi:MAG: ABC transporter substrate-binding protein [Geminicoccaceae bacterium]
MLNGLKLARRAFVAGALLAAGLSQAGAAELGDLKLGVLKFGTVNWELDVIKRHKLDEAEGFNLEIEGFGGNDAGDVALMGGAVDGIVEDWLWVNRQRSLGTDITFIPYSSSVGALMVAADSGIASMADLAGKKIGIAGGPLDKSWLMVRALALKENGIDLEKETEQVFGAPPLLQEKLMSGELDAIINYWHYSARLEAAGYTRLMDVTAAQAALGAEPDTPQLGYIFMQSFAEANADLIAAFGRASRAAKTILDESDEEWEALRERTRAEDDATLEALKRRYREGIVRSWGDKEREDAKKLYAVLQELGGEELVGSSPVLLDGTFWDGVRF